MNQSHPNKFNQNYSTSQNHLSIVAKFSNPAFLIMPIYYRLIYYRICFLKVYLINFNKMKRCLNIKQNI